jgi:actin related protein 2/3 complex subunit 3
MVYHATPPSDGLPTACGVPLMPLRVGGAQQGGAGEGDDVVQEALDAFRANVLFRSFDVESPADKLLIYVTLFLSSCLRRFAAAGAGGAAEAERLAYAAAHEPFPYPGQAGFPLPGLFSAPQSKEEGGEVLSCVWGEAAWAQCAALLSARQPAQPCLPGCLQTPSESTWRSCGRRRGGGWWGGALEWTGGCAGTGRPLRAAAS